SAACPLPQAARPVPPTAPSRLPLRALAKLRRSATCRSPPAPPPPPRAAAATSPGAPAPGFCGHCRRLATGAAERFLLRRLMLWPARLACWRARLRTPPRVHPVSGKAGRCVRSPPAACATLDAGTRRQSGRFAEIKSAGPPSCRRGQSKQRQRRQIAGGQNMKLSRRKSTFLTTVSPGRGYWRRQLGEHVVAAHLKLHGRLRTREFRASSARRAWEPPGSQPRVETAGDRLLISLEFGTARRTPVNQGADGATFLEQPPATSLRFGDGTERETRRSEGEQRPKGRRRAKKSGRKIRRRRDEVGRSQGFHANGVPVLSVAVRNLQFDAVKELLQLGADVNTAGKEKGNTPLHEAVMKGYDGQAQL
uniref:ANK_REP_REGION domain-containing protein n=1 Tax=Macrostomum lignano TaxID=282301 RepID=A0A1I8FMR7_9PLAT